MVKKLEPGLTGEVTTRPLLTLWLACCLCYPAYWPPNEGGTSGGCKAYGLEDIAGVYHKQHLDNLRRKDALRGAETAEISVRLGNCSASHFEGSANGRYIGLFATCGTASAALCVE